MKVLSLKGGSLPMSSCIFSQFPPAWPQIINRGPPTSDLACKFTLEHGCVLIFPIHILFEYTSYIPSSPITWKHHYYYLLSRGLAPVSANASHVASRICIWWGGGDASPPSSPKSRQALPSAHGPHVASREIDRLLAPWLGSLPSLPWRGGDDLWKDHASWWGRLLGGRLVTGSPWAQSNRNTLTLAIHNEHLLTKHPVAL